MEKNSIFVMGRIENPWMLGLGTAWGRKPGNLN